MNNAYENILLHAVKRELNYDNMMSENFICDLKETFLCPQKLLDFINIAKHVAQSSHIVDKMDEQQFGIMMISIANRYLDMNTIHDQVPNDYSEKTMMKYILSIHFLLTLSHIMEINSDYHINHTCETVKYALYSIVSLCMLKYIHQYLVYFTQCDNSLSLTDCYTLAACILMFIEEHDFNENFEYVNGLLTITHTIKDMINGIDSSVSTDSCNHDEQNTNKIVSSDDHSDYCFM